MFHPVFTYYKQFYNYTVFLTSKNYIINLHMSIVVSFYIQTVLYSLCFSYGLPGKIDNCNLVNFLTSESTPMYIKLVSNCDLTGDVCWPDCKEYVKNEVYTHACMTVRVMLMGFLLSTGCVKSNRYRTMC